MVTGVTSFAGRLRWHLQALGFNPLIRATDRLEVLAVLAALLTALIAVPVAAQVGDVVYASSAHTADLQAHDRHAVQAVVLEGGGRMPADVESSASGGPTSLKVQWHEGARLRTEQIASTSMARAGEPLTIWLDNTGKVVGAPLTTDDAEMSAAVATGTLWIAIVACAALVVFLIRRGLDRSRDRAWDMALHLLAHNDDGWANRHA